MYTYTEYIQSFKCTQAYTYTHIHVYPTNNGTHFGATESLRIKRKMVLYSGQK